MKIVHAADLHIDSPLRGLSRYEGAPVERLRGATRRAFEALIELCLREQAALLLIAGDVFDGDWRDYSTGLYFTSQLARLRQAGVRVVMVRGNHDAETRITKDLSLPSNVSVLSSRKPETVIDEQLGLAVHGQSFGTRDVLGDLAASYPAATRGLFNVGLLHTSLGGRPGHAPYAPTTLEVLASKGYDYWALGHVHAREVVSTDPLVIFPGNLQGRHARETGAKGATVLTLADGKLVEHRHEPLDVVRWAACEVDVRGVASMHDVLELARQALAQQARQAQGRLLAARVTLSGACRAHAQWLVEPQRWTSELRRIGSDLDEGEVWIEKIVHAMSGASEHAAAGAERLDALGQLQAQLAELVRDPQLLGSLADSFDDLKRALPAALVELDPALRVDDATAIAQLLPEAHDLVLARLLSTPEEGA